MKRIVVYVLIGCSIILSLMLWKECNRFTDPYYFSKLDMELRLIESIHNDQGTDPLITRAFHNKATGFVLDTARIYTRYFELQLLVSLLGFASCICVFFGGYNIVTTRKKPIIALGALTAIVCIPIIILLLKPNIPFALTLLGIGAPYGVIGVYGVEKLLSKVSFVWVVSGILIVIALSVWWNSLYSPILLEYCVK